jgi:2-keto-3-deoxy-L-rhamnonate aldolase RhmA
MMRPNPLKERLAQGGQAWGTMAFEFFTPGLPAIAAAAGAEFLLLDMEHSGAAMETIKAVVAGCRGLELVPLARVPATQYHFIARLLDAGAMGVIVPMVESAAQAAEIVAATRYPPDGRRGAAFGVAAHDDYAGGAVPELIAGAHRRTMVIALVETAVGIENVDAIAATPGVDVVWLGHFDLTNFMGIPAQFEHPRYLAAVEALLAACRRHGKTPGFMAGDERQARDYQAKGFRMIAYSTDVMLLRDGLARGLAVLRGNAG